LTHFDMMFYKKKLDSSERDLKRCIIFSGLKEKTRDLKKNSNGKCKITIKNYHFAELSTKNLLIYL